MCVIIFKFGLGFRWIWWWIENIRSLGFRDFNKRVTLQGVDITEFKVHFHDSCALKWVMFRSTWQREGENDRLLSRVHQWLGRFLGIIGWDPEVCKSNWLHVDSLRFSFIKLRYILLWIPLKWSVIILQSWTSTGYFSNSTGLSVTNCRLSQIIGVHDLYSQPRQHLNRAVRDPKFVYFSNSTGSSITSIQFSAFMDDCFT